MVDIIHFLIMLGLEIWKMQTPYQLGTFTLSVCTNIKAFVGKSIQVLEI